MLVRAETDDDRAAIHAVVAAAFGQVEEADLVDGLRADGDCVFSLVADEDGALLGHVMLSIMRAQFRALALAPVSVKPERQGQGVGSALIRAAIAMARADGWQGIFVLGDERYYERFGFDVAAAKGFASPFEGDHFALLSLDPLSTLGQGAVTHAPAFFA